MHAPQIYSKFDQDLLFQIRISARASKINDMAVNREGTNKLTPLATSLVDASPPRTTEGEKRLVKGERGDLQRPEGEEGGRSRAAEARRRGQPEEREGERCLGGRRTERSRARGGERSGAGR